MLIAKNNSLRQQLWSTLVFSMPLIGSNMAQSSKHLVDAAMLGRYGIDELAAGVLAGIIFSVTFLVGSGFAMAAIPMTAEARAAGLTWKLRRIVRMSFWLVTIYGVVMIGPLLMTEEFLLLLGQQPEVAALAGEYVTIVLWGIFPAMSVMTLKSFFMALGRPRVILWATVAGAVLNVPANYAFIFGNWGAPELGIKGAAIATIAAHGSSLLIMLIYLAAERAFRAYALLSNLWRPDWQSLISVFRLGWPISVTLIAEIGFFAFCTVMVGWIDTETLAAHGIALESAAFVFMIYLGISNAVTTQVGFAVGAQDRSSLVLAAKAATLLTVATVIVVMTIFLTIPDLLVLAFLDRHSEQAPAVFAIGVKLIYMAAAFQFGDALQIVALGLLRGLSDTRAPMIIAAVSYAMVGFPVSYVLGFVAGLGGIGIWCGFVIGLGLAAILLYARFISKLDSLDFSAGTLAAKHA